MTAVNHAVTGALIVAVVPNPVFAVILAFFSHFILDVLPHYGDSKEINWRENRHQVVLIIDTLAVIVFLVFLLLRFNQQWPMFWLGAVAAMSPDLLWLPYYLNFRRTGEIKQLTPLASFLRKIQWGERPWGWIIEVAWLIGALRLFAIAT